MTAIRITDTAITTATASATPRASICLFVVFLSVMLLLLCKVAASARDAATSFFGLISCSDLRPVSARCLTEFCPSFLHPWRRV